MTTSASDAIDLSRSPYGHLPDEEIATMARMLMRGDLNHEAVCVAARDRIMNLRQQLATERAARERAEGELSEARDEADSMAFHQAGERARWQRELDQANDRLAAAESRLAKVGALPAEWRERILEPSESAIRNCIIDANNSLTEMYAAELEAALKS